MRIIDGEKLYSIKEVGIIFTVNPNQIRKIVHENKIEMVKKKLNSNYNVMYCYVTEGGLNQIGKLLVKYCQVCNKPLLNHHRNKKYCHECRAKIPNHGLPKKKYIEKARRLPTEEFNKRWDVIADSIISNTKTAKRIARIIK